jgi:hypothetical protein
MNSQLKINASEQNCRGESLSVLKLAAVSSEPMRTGNPGSPEAPSAAVSFPLRASGSHARVVSYSRIAAHAVSASAAWLRHRSGKASIHAATAGPIGMGPSGLSKLPSEAPAILDILEREVSSSLDHQAVAAAIVALRGADAVIVGPLSADDANSPGMLAHLTDLASRAYRALRPPRELLVHPGFAQVARRFHFIQMSHHEARALAAGAIDTGILAQRLRQLQGDQGEFAITAFGGNGLLWAEGRFWEIDPIGGDDVDEKRAGAAFCAAWVVARRFLKATVPNALAYARSAAANAAKPAKND